MPVFLESSVIEDAFELVRGLVPEEELVVVDRVVGFEPILLPSGYLDKQEVGVH